jgi:hypothetical protein
MEVKKLEYVFDGWLGDHLVQSFPSFIVTFEAANALNTIVQDVSLLRLTF